MKARYDLDLQFFAEGGGAAAGGGAPAAATATGASEGGQAQTGQPAFDAKAELQKLREKKFGKERADRMANRNKTGVMTPAAEVKAEPTQTQESQAEPTAVTETQPDAEARKAEFKRLMDNDYKDLANEWHNEAFAKRYKQLNDTITAEKSKADGAVKSSAEMAEVADVLMQKYNVKTPAELKTAIEADSSYWEDGAQKAGMTVETYKSYVKTTTELRKIQEAEQIRQADEGQKAQFSNWFQQGMQLKANFPTFDLMTEINSSPQFHNLLKSGIPVEMAYNVTHYSEITKAKEEAAAKAARDAYVEQLKAKNARPAEAALGGNVAKASPAIDVTKLTPADRAELARKVKKTGEPIRFR